MPSPQEIFEEKLKDYGWFRSFVKIPEFQSEYYSTQIKRLQTAVKFFKKQLKHNPDTRVYDYASNVLKQMTILMEKKKIKISPEFQDETMFITSDGFISMKNGVSGPFINYRIGEDDAVLFTRTDKEGMAQWLSQWEGEYRKWVSVYPETRGPNFYDYTKEIEDVGKKANEIYETMKAEFPKFKIPNPENWLSMERIMRKQWMEFREQICKAFPEDEERDPKTIILDGMLNNKYDEYMDYMFRSYPQGYGRYFETPYLATSRYYCLMNNIEFRKEKDIDMKNYYKREEMLREHQKFVEFIRSHGKEFARC